MLACSCISNFSCGVGCVSSSVVPSVAFAPSNVTSSITSNSCVNILSVVSITSLPSASLSSTCLFSNIFVSLINVRSCVFVTSANTPLKGKEPSSNNIISIIYATH